MFEKYLIEHCSPTLASIKTASLFSYKFKDFNELNSAVENWNSMFSDKGIELIVLKLQKNAALIYVCRKKRLTKDLSKDGVAQFLKEYGYESIDIDYAISMLKSRLSSYDEFPHEIGIFLDYPLGDVKGFIENSGANSKYTGFWKVYCNEHDAIKTFLKYKKCRDVYSRLWQSGSKSIMQLTVSA